MSGPWVAIILILVSSLPLIAVYVWFRAAKYQFSLHRFLFALLAGAAAFFPALIFQDMLSFSFQSIRAALFFRFFIRIALTEEISRLILLIIFFSLNSLVVSRAAKKSRGSGQTSIHQPLSINTIKKATATGLVAGLGFALLENAVYAASDINILPLRIIFTAAVHAACGSRIGAAAVLLRSNPFQALLRVFTAVAIHGIYNMMIVMPGFTPLAAILIAISALITAILAIRGGWSDVKISAEETPPADAQLPNTPS